MVFIKNQLSEVVKKKLPDFPGEFSDKSNISLFTKAV